MSKDGEPLRLEAMTRVGVDPDAYPLSYTAVRFDRPGILVGRPMDGPGKFDFWGAHDKRAVEATIKEPNAAIELARVSPGAFANMLAKIAHGYAIAELGDQAFEWRLAPCIQGKADPQTHWIGGSMEPPPATPELHSIRWRIAGAERPLVVVDLRLFCFTGSPPYEIVVGELKGGIGKLPFLEQPRYAINVEQPPPLGEPVPTGRQIIEFGF